MRCSRLISWVVQRQREIRPRTTFLWQEELKKHLAVLPENVFYLINTWAFRDILAGWLEQWDLNMYSFGDNQFIIKSLEFPDNLWFSDKMLIFHHNIIRRYIYIYFFFSVTDFSCCTYSELVALPECQHLLYGFGKSFKSLVFHFLNLSRARYVLRDSASVLWSPAIITYISAKPTSDNYRQHNVFQKFICIFCCYFKSTRSDYSDINVYNCLINHHADPSQQ